MTVATTSREAYHTIQPELKGRRLEVFNALAELGVASNKTIARQLEWEINRVTGRMSELVEMNKVVLARTDLESGFRVKLWRIKETNEQLNLLDQECGA